MIKENLRENKGIKRNVNRSRRARRSCYGELSQYDGSYHCRIEGSDEERCLLLDVDDATGCIMHAKIGNNEGYEETVSFRKERILMHGVPKEIYLDRHSTYKVNQHPKAVDTTKLLTQFENSMDKLGCRLMAANSPQAKGRVERYNGILQDRLIKELKFVGITDIDMANKYIKEVFIPKYNSKYAVKPRIEGDVNRKLTECEIQEIDWIFAVESTRKLSNDYIIQFENNFYQVEQSTKYRVYPKKVLLVAKSCQGKIRIYSGTTSKAIPVEYSKLNANEVKRNRAIYYAEKHRLEREKALRIIKLKNEMRLEKSKEKKYYRLATETLKKKRELEMKKESQGHINNEIIESIGDIE